MRPYHSPSSAALGARCPRAWAYRYLEGLREPDVAWEDIEAGRVEVNPRQRGASFGKALHRVGESFYSGESPDWYSTPGQAFSAGLALLPDPAECEQVEVEAPIGRLPTGLTDGLPPTVLVAHGVRWGGFRDLLVAPTREEAIRLGLPPGEPILVDYKSTSNIAKWAKDASRLELDVQANVYALDVMLRRGLESLACRWVYFQSRPPFQASAVDFRLTRAGVLEVLREPARVCKELDLIPGVEPAPCNSRGCTEYLVPGRGGTWRGGCEFHATNGGPCETPRSLVGYLLLANRLEYKTLLDKSKFSKLQAAPPAPPPTTEAAPPPVGTPEPPPPAAEAAKPKRGRKPKPTQQAAPPAGAGTFAERKASAEAKIAEGQAERAAVLAEIETARDALSALLPGGRGE